MKLKSYGSLAWTERVISSLGEYEEEVRQSITTLERYRGGERKTMLHLGCGAGGHDYHFKNSFQITGVDISEEMLGMARERNPEVHYIQGDMRNVRLNQKFDVVVIPDSIAYMNTLEDLKKAIQTAAYHLRSGGIFLVVVHTKEEFTNNNFVYTGTDGDIHITLFENNYIISESQYEAAMVYLIRQNGKLQIEHDVHTLGLFSHETWLEQLTAARLFINETRNMNELYDRYLLEEGEYKLKVYVCTPITCEGMR